MNALFLLHFYTTAFECARTAFGDDDLGAAFGADVHFSELVSHPDIFSSRRINKIYAATIILVSLGTREVCCHF